MAAINTRIQNKHDVEANWLLATNFRPLPGELIVYDADATHTIPRFKIGRAQSASINYLLSELPFVTQDDAIKALSVSGKVITYTKRDGTTGTITTQDTTYSTMTGATSGADGSGGLAPKPIAGDDDAVLTGAATYKQPNVANGYLQLDERGLIAPAYIPAYNRNCWGVKFDGVNSTGTALGDAVGMSFEPSVGATEGTDDWKSIPIFSAQEVNMTAATGAINAVKGDANFKYDGTNGDVMVKFPKGYYNIKKNPDKSFEVWISDMPAPGFLDSPAHYRGVSDSANIYVAKYKAYWDGTKICSQSGVYPTDSMTRGVMRSRAAALGAGFCQYDIATHSWIEMLAHVKYKNLNSQSAIGSGLQALPYSAENSVTIASESANTIIVSNATAAKFAVGLTVSLGSSLGSADIFNARTITDIITYNDDNKSIVVTGAAFTTSVGNVLWCCGNITGDCNNVPGTCGRADYLIGTASQIKIFNLESPWADRWTWEDGIITNFEDGVNQSYICLDPSKYNDSNVSNYIKVGYTNSITDGYIKEWGYDENLPWCRICSVIGGDSAKPVGDYYYRSDGSSRVSCLGGRLALGTYCGLSFRGLDYSSGSAGWYIVGRFQKI